MIKFAIGTVLLLSFTAVQAQTIPDEATKTRALKRAYQLNGNSMDGFGNSIDLSGGIPPDDAKCHLMEGAVTGQKFFECDQPIDKPAHVDVEGEQPDLNMEDLRKFIRRYNRKITNFAKPHDVCTIHHMHKVYSGDSWRCRK